MCQIQHLNLDLPRFEEGLLLLAIYEEVRSNLGNIQGIFGQGLRLAGFLYRRHKKSPFWSTLVYYELESQLSS